MLYVLQAWWHDQELELEIVHNKKIITRQQMGKKLKAYINALLLQR